MQPNLLGNRPERPAVLREMTDLLIAPAPVGTTLEHPVGEMREGFSLGQRGRGRRLDDAGLVHAAWGEPGGRHVERL
jgi:hypothetical protein